MNRVNQQFKTAAPIPAVAAPSGLLQRKCACGTHTVAGGECGDCGRKSGVLRRSGEGQVAGVPTVVGEVLDSPGSPLDAGARQFMESRFGHDFSRVRVHTDARADESARSVGARAYTVGDSVVFAAGQYAPSTASGRMLLAHELTHIVQQRGTGGAVQTRLEVGSAHDPAESEADRVAQQVMSAGEGPAAADGPADAAAAGVRHRPPQVSRTPAVLRRIAGCPSLEETPLDTALAGGVQTGPQEVGQRRMVTLPEVTRGVSRVTPHVIRHLTRCPCRRIPETRQGVYWNPDPGNFAIAFRYCRGGTAVDVYGQLRSNLPSVVTSGADPRGTARAGVDVNVMGRVVNGRVVVEVVGTNQPAGTAGTPGAVPGGTPGVGGRAQLVLQGNNFVLFFDGEYIRRLGQLAPGVDPNQWNFGLGGGTPNLRGSVRVTGEGGGVGVIIGVGGTFGGPSTRPEDCHTCYCPPAKLEYCCIDFEHDREVPVEVESHPLGEYRYYFRLDRAEDTLSPTAASDSRRQMDAMAAELTRGGVIESITGYASPEAPERTHNQDLSERRGRRLGEIVRQRVPTGTQVPAGDGGGELYGRRFADPTPAAGQAVTGEQFRDAEQFSHFLMGGEEIPNRELSDRFVHIFNALPNPTDRLSLFGLAPADPLAGEVLAAIEQFMRSPRRGARPWERIFQYLRVGVVRVRRRVVETVNEWRRGSVNAYSGDECRTNARMAEAQSPGFGPLADSARRPQSTTTEARAECRQDPSDGGTPPGCDYTPPGGGGGGGRPSVAPEVAPRPFGQLR